MCEILDFVMVNFTSLLDNKKTNSNGVNSEEPDVENKPVQSENDPSGSETKDDKLESQQTYIEKYQYKGEGDLDGSAQCSGTLPVTQWEQQILEMAEYPAKIEPSLPTDIANNYPVEVET